MDDIESFRATQWHNQQEMLALQAFSIATETSEHKYSLPDVDTDSLQAREVKYLSLAFSKGLCCMFYVAPE